MTHALVINRAWPANPDQATHGIFQRLSLFLDALSQSFDEVELMLFAPQGESLQANALSFEAILRGKHGHRIHVNAQPRRPSPSPWGIESRYLASSLSVDRQENYINLAGSEHVAAVQMALWRDPALVFVHRLPCFTPLWPLRKGLKAPLLFDMDDLEHKALARAVIAQPRWPSERLRLLHVPAIMWRERAALRLSAASFVCSEKDGIALRRLGSTPKVHVIPNTVHAPGDIRSGNIPFEVLGFLGSFAHPPNVDAVRWLLSEIWPGIRRNKPNARLRIAGSGSMELFDHAHGKDGIEVLGFVPDLVAFYQSLSIVIAPLRFGAGTRVKIIEAAGYAMPVVTTTLGAEGLAFESGPEIMVADSAVQFVNACVQLLARPDKAIAMGLASRRCFERHYDRSYIVAAIKGHIVDSLASTASAEPSLTTR